jgi:anti-sigma-K factor RskA
VIDERTEELATAYVLGALEAEDSRQFERELEHNAELRALVADLRGVSEVLGGSAPGLTPPAALRTKILMELDGIPMRRSGVGPRPAGWLPWALAAGFAALCLLFGWQTQSLHTQLQAQQRRVDQLNELTRSLRAEGDDLRQTVLTLQQSNRLANVRIAVLSAQLHTDPQAVAVSVWDNERQTGVVVVHHLKPPPKDKDYQLWVIDPHYPTPVDAGVLQVDDAGNGRVEFKARRPIESANQFAVTEEVKGGAPVPTLKAMVLAGA